MCVCVCLRVHLCMEVETRAYLMSEVVTVMSYVRIISLRALSASSLRRASAAAASADNSPVGTHIPTSRQHSQCDPHILQ